MADTGTKWRGPEFDDKLRKEAAGNLYRAGEHLLRAMKEEIGLPAPRIRLKRKRATVRGRKGSSLTLRKGSTPPAPPFKRTGFLQRNTIHEHDAQALESRLGVTKAGIYGFYLEVGYRLIRAGRVVGRQPPRPWMRLSLVKQSPAIGRLIGRYRDIR